MIERSNICHRENLISFYSISCTDDKICNICSCKLFQDDLFGVFFFKLQFWDMFQLIFCFMYEQIISIVFLWYLWRSIERLFFELSITELKNKNLTFRDNLLKKRNSTYMLCRLLVSAKKNSFVLKHNQFTYKDTFLHFLFLVHLNRRFKRAFLITRCTSSVHLSVCP